MNTNIADTAINERIKHLRKNILKLTQNEFSQKINLKRTTVGNIEANNINVTDRNITTISDTFGISEVWLRTGIEPIYISTALEDKIPRISALVTSKVYGDPVKQQIVIELLELINGMDQPQWDIIIKFSEAVAKTAKAAKEAKIEED